MTSDEIYKIIKNPGIKNHCLNVIIEKYAYNERMLWVIIEYLGRRKNGLNYILENSILIKHCLNAKLPEIWFTHSEFITNFRKLFR